VRRFNLTHLGLTLGLGAALLARPAAAQMGPGMGPGMQPPPAGQNQEKEEGPAEEAPEENRPHRRDAISVYLDSIEMEMQ